MWLRIAAIAATSDKMVPMVIHWRKSDDTSMGQMVCPISIDTNGDHL